MPPQRLLGSVIEGETNIRLVRHLARGGFAVVYQGILQGVEGFEKVIAVKTILERYSRHPEFIDLFLGEAKLVADLVHQNIVQIYNLGKFDSTYYMAMEYVAGVNLRQFLQRHLKLKRQLPPELAIFIASRISRGLEYAHKKRDPYGRHLEVVHRDVSPPNILISTEGEVKVTDFGIAKAQNLMRDEEGTVLMGKTRYMSPEQACYKNTDHRSDLFSLGICLYEMLTLKRPFEGETKSEVVEALCNGRFAPPREYNEDVPGAYEKIVMKMLQPDVEDRYQSASELSYDLEYAIYHQGYGPTIMVLENYLRDIFPHLFTKHPRDPSTHEETPSKETSSAIAFLQRNLPNRTNREVKGDPLDDTTETEGRPLGSLETTRVLAAHAGPADETQRVDIKPIQPPRPPTSDVKSADEVPGEEPEGVGVEEAVGNPPEAKE